MLIFSIDKSGGFIFKNNGAYPAVKTLGGSDEIWPLKQDVLPKQSK